MTTQPDVRGLVTRVRERLSVHGGSDGPSSWELAQVASREAHLLLDSVSLAGLSDQVAAEIDGAGRLEALLAVPGVTDILVNGAEDVWLDCGEGLERSSVGFGSAESVRALAVRLAAQAGRRLDDASPFVDAVLSDGTRLHAILPPLVPAPTVSLRVLGRRRLNLTDLVDAQMLPRWLADLLRSVVAARFSVLISGGTGAGKTTLLAALLSQVPVDERIVTIEDTPELMIDHPHRVRLVARAPNGENAGGVDLAELVRQSLRMRADRLVVGEFRGAEMRELLAALNTGHPGGAATVHANSLADVPARLAALGSLAGLSTEAVHLHARSAIDVLVQVSRLPGVGRRVTEVALWPRVDGDLPLTVFDHRRGPGAGAARLLAALSDVGEVPTAAGAALGLPDGAAVGGNVMGRTP